MSKPNHAASRRRASRSWVAAALSATLLFVTLQLTACGGVKDDPILQLSAAEALEQGKVLMTEKKYRQAAQYLIHAFEVEPNSLSGREGLLLAADARFFEDTASGYTEAESRYRDFINRFPTSSHASYAQYRIALCLAQRMAKPNRDQETARKALAAFQDLLRLYPTSEYASSAREEMTVVTDNLAEHEFQVGSFYLRFGLARSAVDRFKLLLEKYPSYGEQDKILFYLCRAYDKSEQPENAAETCSRLRAEHPDSPYLNNLPEIKEAASDVDEAAAASVATNGRL